jgi:ParB-like chromosome segregation protein Spo0J
MASLKAAAEDKTNTDVSKTTAFAVNPRVIKVEEGFNARPLNPEHVAEMSLAWRNGAVFPPLEVRVEDGRIILVDGHHRHAAALDAIEKGLDIKTVDVRQFRGNDADRVAHMITSAGGLPLTPLQLGIQYRKLIHFGWTEKEIAGRTGKSGEHVRNMILLGEANSDVHQLVNAGQISGTAAVAVIKEHGSKAGQVIRKSLQQVQASGKSKVTTGVLAKHRAARTPKLKVTLEWIAVDTKLPDDDTLVLLALNDDDVWTGYRDGNIWRYADAMPLTAERVTHWMHMPAVPFQEKPDVEPNTHQLPLIAESAQAA